MKTAWTWVTPLVALLALSAGMFLSVTNPAIAFVLFCILLGAVLTGVHHAEVVAHRVGEPFGTLVLALAVTVIELALIGSMMMSGSPAASTLARDTVYATVMIVCNGVVGLCLLAGALRHHV